MTCHLSRAANKRATAPAPRPRSHPRPHPDPDPVPVPVSTPATGISVCHAFNSFYPRRFSVRDTNDDLTTRSPFSFTPHIHRQGDAHEEGWYLRQVRHALRRDAAESHQEDGGDAARQVQLLVLRQEQHQAAGDWHLEVPAVQEGPGRWRVRVKVR